MCDCMGEVRFGLGPYDGRRRVGMNRTLCRPRKKAVFGQKPGCLCRHWRHRVALCFWGVNRSLNRTIDSIKAMLVEPLKERADVDIFFHTYTLSHVDSSWAGEKHSSLAGPVDELERFRSLGTVRRWEATDQGNFDRGTDWSSYRKAQGYRDDTVRNLLRAAYSLKRVTDLWLLEDISRNGQRRSSNSSNFERGYIGEGNGESFSPPRQQQQQHERGYYDAVVYARPDLNYTSPLDVDLLFALRPDELYTPTWSTFHGVNDRFAAGRPDAALAFGNRLDAIRDAVSHHGLDVHSETILDWILTRNHIRPIHVQDPCGKRVRSTGAISELDCDLIEKRFRKHPSLSNPSQYRNTLLLERRYQPSSSSELFEQLG